MPLSLWPWAVGGGMVVVVVAALRWEFADFVLDRIGALADWMRGRRSEHDTS